MEDIKNFFKKAWSAIANLVSINNFAWYALGILATVILVDTGLDAKWFVVVQGSPLYKFFSLAGLLGFFVPFMLFFILLFAGIIFGSRKIRIGAWVSGLGATLGFLFSTLIKIFTGRIPPPHGLVSNVLELSHGFRFGILHGGIFWGWPSSHTATAFGMSVALALYFKNQKWLGVIAILYACYIGIGASMSFHWLSDVVMGAILGGVIGILVGREFSK